MTVPSLTRFKRCVDCECTKPATADFFYLTCRKNLNRRCKPCHIAFNRPRKQLPAYHEYQQGYNARYYHENREVELERRAAHRKANPHIKAEADRRYVANLQNRPTARERYLERMRKDQNKHRANKARAEGVYGVDEIVQMYDDQGGLCCYCEAPLFGTYDTDHMTPLSRGGRNDWPNLAIACPACNRSKCDKTAEEFMNR